MKEQQRITDFRIYLKRLFCEHELQADTQITFVKCKKCGKKYYYEKNVNIYK